MFCKNCGNFVGESDRFCETCGAEITQNTNEPVSQTSGQPVDQVSLQPAQKPLGMKWYKFVVNVQLFLSMIVSVGNGGRYLNDTMNGTKEEWNIIYTVFPRLRILNIVFGVIQILYVGFLAVIRYRMVKFKKNAPILYIISFLIQIVLEWIWIAVLIASTSTLNVDYSSQIYGTILTDILWVIYIVLNIIYFKKRKFAFSK